MAVAAVADEDWGCESEGGIATPPSRAGPGGRYRDTTGRVRRQAGVSRGGVCAAARVFKPSDESRTVGGVSYAAQARPMVLRAAKRGPGWPALGWRADLGGKVLHGGSLHFAQQILPRIYVVPVHQRGDSTEERSGHSVMFNKQSETHLFFRMRS